MHYRRVGSFITTISVTTASGLTKASRKRLKALKAITDLANSVMDIPVATVVSAMFRSLAFKAQFTVVASTVTSKNSLISFSAKQIRPVRFFDVAAVAGLLTDQALRLP